MAVVLIEGFDSYNGVGLSPGIQSRWTFSTGTIARFSMVAGRFGGQALSQNTATTGQLLMRLPLPAAYASITLGVAMRVTDLPAGVGLVQCGITLQSDTTYQLGFRVNINGAIEVYRMATSSTGTLLGTTASGLITAGPWNYLEFEVTISDTVGVVNVWLNSVSVLALSGLDTRNGVPTTVNAIQLGQASNTNGNGIIDYDDLYITDSAAKLGERRVETLYPSADVAAGAWVPSTGVSHFAMVDEATVNVADYISASVVGETDRFTHAGLSTTPASVDAVQVVAYANKTDATARSIALQTKSGATTTDGASFALPASVNQIRGDLKLVDPNTAVAWTAAGVNALEFGVKVTV